MEKLVSITAALDAGKLPSTQQTDAFIVWLNESALPAAQPSGDNEAALSDQGRVLADDTHNVLNSYRTLNSNKNGDNLLQEIIWHLTEGDVNAAVGAPNVNKEEITSDIDTVRSSLRTLLTLFWQSLFSEDNFLLGDFASFARLGLADVAEIVEEQAGQTKEGLRNVEQEVEEGKRDNLGRDKARLDEEKGDTRATFENRMDTLKDTGSTAIGAHQSTKAKAQDLSGQTNERLRDMQYNAYYKFLQACKTAQNDPQYHDSLSTLLDTLEKWVNKALDADASQPLTLDAFFADTTPTPEQDHVREALAALKVLLDRFAQPESSVDAVLGATQRFANAVREPGHKAEVKAWVDRAFAHARRGLDDPEYPGSEESAAARRDLEERGRALLDENTDAGRAWAGLKDTVRAFGTALASDADVERVRKAHAQLGADAARGFAEAGKQAALEMDLAPWFWRDMVAVYLPRALALLKGFPIPRTEYVDDDVELVLEDLDVSSLQISPAHVKLRSTTDVDVKVGEGVSADMGVGTGTRTEINLHAVQLALKDVSFFYKDKHGGHAPGAPRTFTGLLTLTLPPHGLSADIHLRLLPPADRAKRQAFHAIERANVQLADDVQIGVRQGNHPVALTLFKPVFKRGVRSALQRALTTQLRAALESADAVAWDAGKRARVFKDMGVGQGAALVGGVWSEVGRLIRERSVAVSATGTGVVVMSQDDEKGESEARFAMGAEPQVLPGEKRGPAGTGSQSIASESRAGQDGYQAQQRDVAKEGQKQVQGLTGEARGQVRSFRRSVDERTAMEKSTPGWQSSAFDV
ncbi:hypothetical protein B0H11DRAFT_1922583 [Mycena galericulata]|nr:hypothetical protein B0H11DRAFT_1922583 [Mycena galericulata]